jgi:hypothetical protein
MFFQFRNCGAKHRARRSRFTNDFRGYALPDLAFRFAVHQQREIGVTVQVDEPWGNHQAFGIDRALGRGVADPPDFRDRAGVDGDGPLVPGVSTAVQDVGIDDDYVVLRLFTILRISFVWRESYRSKQQRDSDVANQIAPPRLQGTPPQDTEYSPKLVCQVGSRSRSTPYP